MCFYHIRNFCLIKHMPKMSGFWVTPPPTWNFGHDSPPFSQLFGVYLWIVLVYFVRLYCVFLSYCLVYFCQIVSSIFESLFVVFCQFVWCIFFRLFCVFLLNCMVFNYQHFFHDKIFLKDKRIINLPLHPYLQHCPSKYE